MGPAHRQPRRRRTARIAYRAARLIAERDSAAVAQASFQGLNPILDDRAPALLLRDGDLAERRTPGPRRGPAVRRGGMSQPDSTPLDTPQGPSPRRPLRNVHLPGRLRARPVGVDPMGVRHRRPLPGRWDDPDGVWRTLYCGTSALACYLEVCAFARPSPN